MILSHYGEETWEKIKTDSNVDSSWRIHECYSDSIFVSMMRCFCDHVNISDENVCEILICDCDGNKQ